jgi:hypothetical protein
MNVLLVQPYTFTVRGLPQPPLALLCVGGYAEQKGHTVKILDRNIETDPGSIINDFDHFYGFPHNGQRCI